MGIIVVKWQLNLLVRLDLRLCLLRADWFGVISGMIIALFYLLALLQKPR